MCGATTNKKMEWRRRELCGQNLGVQQSAPTVRIAYHTILMKDPLMHINDYSIGCRTLAWSSFLAWFSLVWLITLMNAASVKQSG